MGLRLFPTPRMKQTPPGGLVKQTPGLGTLCLHDVLAPVRKCNGYVCIISAQVVRQPLKGHTAALGLTQYNEGTLYQVKPLPPLIFLFMANPLLQSIRTTVFLNPYARQ